MSKKMIRYFFGFIESQQRWLNAMSGKGFRLINTGKLIYEFERCKPNEFQYCVDFVAEKSYSELNNYKNFLREMGYHVFSKNINLNWSFGKVTYRPYGEGMGKLATSPGTYNKELLIVEKANDGSAFKLHTTVQDRLKYYKRQLNACLTLLLLGSVLLGMEWYSTKAFTPNAAAALALSLAAAVPSVLFLMKVWQLARDSNIGE